MAGQDRIRQEGLASLAIRGLHADFTRVVEQTGILERDVAPTKEAAN